MSEKVTPRETIASKDSQHALICNATNGMKLLAKLQNHLLDFVLGAFVTDLYVDFQNSRDFVLGNFVLGDSVLRGFCP